MIKLEELLKDKDWTLEDAKSMYETCNKLILKTDNKNLRDQLITVLNYCYQLMNNDIIGYDQNGNVIIRYNVKLLKKMEA